jgi:hypothetical protein
LVLWLLAEVVLQRVEHPGKRVRLLLLPLPIFEELFKDERAVFVCSIQ